MKNLLLSASKIALAFSFILHTAHAMEDENLDMDVEIKSNKRKADAIEDNSGMDFGSSNHNSRREANAIEDQSGTKKSKKTGTEITFPLDNIFPIIQNYTWPDELTAKIVMALGFDDRKAYNRVNHQCKNFIDFYTYRISLTAKAFIKESLLNTVSFPPIAFLSRFPNLENLKINPSIEVTNDCMKSLTKLKHLSLLSDFIMDEALSSLTNLEKLEIGEGTQITDDAIRFFTKLKTLNLENNGSITDEALSDLTNLAKLNLAWTFAITNDGITSLTKLTSLNLCENEEITDDALKLLTNLTNLDLGYNEQITDAGLSNLTNIEKLDIIAAPCITLSSLQHLTKLRSLRFDIDKFNVCQLIEKSPSLSSLDHPSVGMEAQKVKQNLIDLIEDLFSLAERNRDKINATELSALKKLYEIQLLPLILDPEEREKYTSTYPTKAISYSVEEMIKIRNVNNRLERESLGLTDLLKEDGIDLINRLFAINNRNVKMIIH